MLKQYRFIILVLILMGKLQAFTQVSPVTPASKPKTNVSSPTDKKNALPKLKTSWGGYSGTNIMLSADIAKALLEQPIVILDEKNQPYQLNSYQFGYRRRGTKQDEETGEVSPQTDMIIQLFKTNTLSELWRTNISETLHKGEELYFFDVIVYLKSGKLSFAPELKVIIQ